MCVTLLEHAMYGHVLGYTSWCSRVKVPKTRSGRAWICGSGEHHYHRFEHIAKLCAPNEWVEPLPPEVEARLRDPSPLWEQGTVRLFADA